MGKPKKTRLTEAHYERLLTTLLELDGWLVLKTDAGVLSKLAREAIRSDIPPGFPDLIAMRPDRVVFIEMKTPGNRLSPIQRIFHALLAERGFAVYVVYGADYSELARDGILSERVLRLYQRSPMLSVRRAE